MKQVVGLHTRGVSWMTIGQAKTLPLRSTQEAILDVACELIAAHGFGGMSMRALALGVGIQPGSLYSHFSCKQDVLEEIVERLVTKRFHDWLEGKPNPRNPARQLDVFLNIYVENSAGHRASQQVLVTEIRHLSGASGERVKRHCAAYVDELHGIINRGNACGVFNTQDTAVAAQAILAILDGLSGAGQLNADASRQKLMFDVKHVINKILGAG